MSRIVVEYNPDISEDSKELIKAEITPSMVSNDGSSSQYAISMVADILLERQSYSKDVFYINDLIIDGVSFVEF